MSDVEKSCAVMCCGCGHLLNKDGTLGAVVMFNGILRFDVYQRFHYDQAATFDGRIEADEFAMAHGWEVFDRDGPNHRCPECVKKRNEKQNEKALWEMGYESERRGAYIPVSLLSGERPSSLDAQTVGGVATS